MIRIAQTSKGMVVFALSGGWGDWYQVGLFDEHLVQLAWDEDELHEESGLECLWSIWPSVRGAQAVAAQWVPDPPQRRSWFRFR